MSVHRDNTENDRLAHALGDGVVRLWSALPPDLQQQLFEDVVARIGEDSRQPLAVFLHAHHPRTIDSHEDGGMKHDSKHEGRV